MALGNGLIPWVICVRCDNGSYLLTSGCPDCGMSAGQSRVFMDPRLCLCDAEQAPATQYGPAYNVIHYLQGTCPPDRGLPDED